MKACEHRVRFLATGDFFHGEDRIVYDVMRCPFCGRHFVQNDNSVIAHEVKYEESQGRYFSEGVQYVHYEH